MNVREKFGHTYIRSAVKPFWSQSSVLTRGSRRSPSSVQIEQLIAIAEMGAAIAARYHGRNHVLTGGKCVSG